MYTSSSRLNNYLKSTSEGLNLAITPDPHLATILKSLQTSIRYLSREAGQLLTAVTRGNSDHQILCFVMT